MDKRNRSNSLLDSESKLEQYRIINHELTLAIASLKIRIKHLNNENLNHRNENMQWRLKFSSLKRMFVEHIQLMTVHIQSNAEKINNLTDLSNNEMNEESSTSPRTTSVVDVSRRVSKSFEKNKNLSEEPFDEGKFSLPLS